DAGFPGALERMGCAVERDADGVAAVAPSHLRGAEIDLKDMPDAGPALAVVAAFADAPTVIRGVRTLRVKETDRIAAARIELAKIGCTVEEDFGGDPDVMRVVPGADPGGAVSFATYDDHRMAMSLALVSLRRGGVTVEDPKCVGKTYPTFWLEWTRLIRL
ncbi:MAG: 3-phosphoshikimate 1-carboxyvinyltransferase, partial [Phycisphaerales bacterium]